MHRTRGKSPARAVKAFLACVLALAFLTIPLTACTKLPDTGSSEVNLVIKVPRTGHDVVFDDSIEQIEQVIQMMADDFSENYEKANVNIDLQVFEQNQYDEAIANTLGTDKAPDIIYGDYFNISTYIHSGYVVPLDDIITPEMEDDIFDYLWGMSYIEDHYYMMPFLARQNILAYNKEMFREAGLEGFIEDGKITSWSLDEWTYILDALADSLPEAAYPMMMYANSSQGDTHIMTLLRSAGSSFFDDDGHFNLSTPEGIEALRWIQDGVDRGWYPPHCENLEIEDCSSLFRSGQLAIYMVNNASISRYGDSVGLVNFPGPDEDGCTTTFVSGFEVLDNGDAQKLQVAKDFISYVYGSKELMSYAAGTLPASSAVSDEYGDDISYFDLFLANRSNVVDFTGSNPDTRAVREVFYKRIHDLLTKKATPEETAALIDEECNAAIDEGVANSTLHP